MKNNQFSKFVGSPIPGTKELLNKKSKELLLKDIPSNVLGKYNINMFMDYLDGLARKLEPRIYDEENPYDREDGELSDFNGELNLLNIAAEYINTLEYEDDLKDRLKISVQDLYKRTLSSNYED